MRVPELLNQPFPTSPPPIPHPRLRFLRQIFSDSLRAICPAPHKPHPASWSNGALTAAWLGHATVLMNFHGVHVLTDPVFSQRAGLRILPGFTLGPKRYVQPALTIPELPRIDLVLLTHAHMDHLDLASLKKLDRSATVVTARATTDLLHGMNFKKIIELDWNQSAEIQTRGDSLRVEAFEVKHWGARMQHDTHRGYNGYVLERVGRRVVVCGDTSFTPLFKRLNGGVPVDLMFAPIAAYDPWIAAHCTPEQAVEMADMAGALYVMPIHHQTFKLSWEAMDEPIARFKKALAAEPWRIALTEIGETFTLP
jgi:L-ascorbate metabolism protein UlaG (beta-lactamase superfamily)